ncbi:MAG: trypsin-like peptidase domain-containing protein [Bryobacterales bacterium]
MRRLRPLLLAFLLTAAFVLWTTAPDRGARIASSAGEQFWTEARSAGLTTEELSNIDIYQRALPATVNITSTVLKQNWFFEVYPTAESGSGFLIDADGRILTNHHVIRGNAPSIEVTLTDKRRFRAEVIAFDEINDLALIKIKADDKLPHLPLGSSDDLKVGQKVLAIGNPFGLEGTLTTGVISSVGRSIRDQKGVLEDMVQTDAAINPGNSGGPLLDSSGNVIGVNTAIYGPGGNIGIGFAMPIGRAKPLLEFARTGGKAHPPEPVGVGSLFLTSRQALTLDLPATPGYLVYEVTPGSAADEAGLRGASQEIVVGNEIIPWGGDYVVEVDGRGISNGNLLRQILALKQGGSTLRLKVIREGRELEIEVKLRPQPQQL